MAIELIAKYFPSLTQDQKLLFSRLGPVYTDWNAKVNLVSRTDIENLYERHILHSLSIAKFIKFKQGTRIMDLGTGGGFPGIPLALLFPEVSFTLTDSIGKKIKVVEDVILQLGLKNVVAVCERAEKIDGDFDYIVSRAAAPLSDLYKWSRPQISKKQINAIPNGIICLKGGDLKTELQPFKGRAEVVHLSNWFQEEYFATKQLVFLPV